MVIRGRLRKNRGCEQNGQDRCDELFHGPSLQSQAKMISTVMPPEPSPMVQILRNMLQHGDLPFRDFVEVALYHPEYGYYTSGNRVGREGDFVTSPHLSSVFPFTLGKLVREFLSRAEDDVCTVVDIGCGDGRLIRELSAIGGARYIGVDRTSDEFRTIDQIPRGGTHLILSNELFDALPFARLVKRGDDLHELWVDENLEWTERSEER